jgi:tRNA dimethylallyltransferase
VVDRILAEGKTPIVVGGTGLYMRAALADLRLPPPAPAGVRERFERLYDRVGAERAHAILGERDPRAASAVHPNDRRRVVRALELTELESSLHALDNRLWSRETRHPTVMVGLELPKDVLSARIAERTRRMFDEGVQEEVRAALRGRVSPTASRILGLTEVAGLPHEEAIASVVRRTEQLARYQRKWMRRLGLVTVDADRPPGEVADDVLEVARSREHLSPVREDSTHP